MDRKPEDETNNENLVWQINKSASCVRTQEERENPYKALMWDFQAKKSRNAHPPVFGRARAPISLAGPGEFRVCVMRFCVLLRLVRFGAFGIRPLSPLTSHEGITSYPQSCICIVTHIISKTDACGVYPYLRECSVCRAVRHNP